MEISSLDTTVLDSFTGKHSGVRSKRNHISEIGFVWSQWIGKFVMEKSNSKRNAQVDLSRFGLAAEAQNSCNDVEIIGCGADGYRPTSRNELFAGEEVSQRLQNPIFDYDNGIFHWKILRRMKNHGGRRNSSYQSRCCLVCGMVCLRRVWLIFSVLSSSWDLDG